MTRPLPANAERRLLDYPHLAAYLSVSLRTAKQIAADGKIPKVKIESKVLFDRADADAYIEKLKRVS